MYFSSDLMRSLRVPGVQGMRPDDCEMFSRSGGVKGIQDIDGNRRHPASA